MILVEIILNFLFLSGPQKSLTDMELIFAWPKIKIWSINDLLRCIFRGSNLTDY